MVVNWDRQGRYLFERTRLEFLQHFRELLEMLPRTTHSVINVGQSVLLLEDFLEIYSDEHELIKSLSESGKLAFGPWYIEPDPFLVTSEVLIRNLLAARRIGDEIGIPVTTYMVSPNRMGQLVQFSNGFDITVVDGESEASYEVVLPTSLRSITNYYQLPLRRAKRTRPLPETIEQTDIGRYSARLWLKQQNYALETEMVGWVEPFASWLRLLQPTDLVEPELVQHAWLTLLQTQSGSTLSGFAHDDVYKEVSARLSQIEQLATEISTGAASYLLEHIDTSSIIADRDALSIVVLNPSSITQTAVVHTRVHQRLDGGFVARSADQIESIVEVSTENDASIIHFLARDVPAHGYSSFKVVARDRDQNPESPPEHAESIENEFLSVTVDREEGTLTLYDKRTGTVFPDLHRFVDGGDAGMLQQYQRPAVDTVINVATNAPLAVQRHVDETGQYLQYLQIFRLPQHLKSDGTGRLPLAAQFVPISIVTNLHLTPGVPRLDVSTFVTNNASDHRLQVLFPTPIIADDAYWDAPFEVVKRAAQGVAFPLGAFVSVMDDEVGMTIANFGLPQATVSRNNDDSIQIALTLLRSVGASDRYDGILEVPEAQSHDDYEYAYSIIPHAPDDMLDAWHAAWAFQTLPRAYVQATQTTRQLPPALSIIEIDKSEFLLSTVKLSENGEGVVVRGYNVSDEDLVVSLQLNLPHIAIELTRLDETSSDNFLEQGENGAYALEVAPKEIVTMLVHTER